MQILDQRLSSAVPVEEVGAVDLYGQGERVSVDQDVALSPSEALCPVVPTLASPARVVFTIWLSITAAVGSRARPSDSRTLARDRPLPPEPAVEAPPAEVVVDGLPAVGYSWGSILHEQPERSRQKTASAMHLVVHFHGRPRFSGAAARRRGPRGSVVGIC